MSTGWVFVILCLLYGVSSALLSRRFPPLNPDEIIVAVSSYNFLHGHGIRYSLYDDIFAPSAYTLRDLSNHISRKLYEVWAGLWTFSRDPWVSRGSACVAGLAVLLIFFQWGSLRRDRRFGLGLAGLFLLNPVFWMSSLIINEHVLLLAGMGLVLWLSTLDPVTVPRAQAGAGFAAGLLFMVHPNALFFILAWLGFVFFQHSGQPRRWLFIHMGSGLVIGILISFLSVDWQRFLLFQKTIYWQFAQPPLFTWPWMPLQWIRATAGALWNGPTYYFNTSLVRGWQPSLHLFWMAMGVSCVMAFTGWREKPSEIRRWTTALAGGLMITLVAMTLLMRRQEVFYAVLLLPWLLPLAAQGLASAAGVRAWFRGGSSVLLIGSFCFLAAFILQYSRLYKPYEVIVKEVRRMAPGDDLKVAGPCVLWFGFPDRQFRDLGAVVISRYYTNGAWNLKDWLGPWRPDVLILDETFRRIFLARQADAARLGRLLGAQAHLDGEVDTGAAYGTLGIYRITWPPA